MVNVRLCELATAAHHYPSPK